MESASDAFHKQLRRIQAELLRLGWHQPTGNRAAFPSTPVASVAGASGPLDGSPMTTIQSALAAAKSRAGGVATEALPSPTSVLRAPSSSAPLGVLGEHDVNRVAGEGRRSYLTSLLTACGAADGFKRVGVQPLHQHHGDTARGVVPPTHWSAGGTSRAAEPPMFVRYVCDREHDSAQVTDDVLAYSSSALLPFPPEGSMTVDDAFDDIIARAWGGAETLPVTETGGLTSRRMATASLHTGAGRQWSREGCAASSGAASPFTVEVRYPAVSSYRAASPSTVSVPVSSFLSSPAVQPPTVTQLHDSGRLVNQRARAPATRIVSPVGAGAVYRSSTHADRPTDALGAQGRKPAMASSAPPPAPTPKHAAEALQRQHRMLRALQLVDAALHSSSDGSSEGNSTKRLARLHQILATLTDVRGQPLALPSRATTTELRRFRKRLVQELLLGEPTPGVLQRYSTSSRVPSQPSAPPAPPAAIRDNFEGDDEADARRCCAVGLADAAGGVQLARLSASPAPVASPPCFAMAHSDITARIAATSASPAHPLSPPSPSALDPYTASQQRFQLEMASLHQAQQRRLQLQRRRTGAR